MYQSYVYFGTAPFAETILSALLAAGIPPKAVVTTPDRPAGRGQRLQPAPVKQSAQKHSIELIQPHTIDTDSQLKQRLAQVDLGLVVAYGYLIPPAILTLPKYGCINIHASLVPRWRGAAPIQRAILAGDKTTGISILQMDSGLDTGAVLHQRQCPITATETSASLHDKLALIGSEAIIDHMRTKHTPVPIAQNNALATYAPKIHKQDGKIDWHQSTELIERTIRACNPVPIAWTCYHNSTVRLWQAHALDTGSNHQPGTITQVDTSGIGIATANGTLCITELQLPGGRKTQVKQLLNGRTGFFRPGSICT